MRYCDAPNRWTQVGAGGRTGSELLEEGFTEILLCRKSGHITFYDADTSIYDFLHRLTSTLAAAATLRINASKHAIGCSNVWLFHRQKIKRVSIRCLRVKQQRYSATQELRFRTALKSICDTFRPTCFPKRRSFRRRRVGHKDMMYCECCPRHLSRPLLRDQILGHVSQSHWIYFTCPSEIEPIENI